MTGRAWRFRCDYRGCVREVSVTAPTEWDARQALPTWGWTTSPPGKVAWDHCPQHS